MLISQRPISYILILGRCEKVQYIQSLVLVVAGGGVHEIGYPNFVHVPLFSL